MNFERIYLLFMLTMVLFFSLKMYTWLSRGFMMNRVE